MTLSSLLMVGIILLFMVGFVGNFLPVIPGSLIVWFAIFLHKILLPDASVSWLFFWLATALTIFAQLLDFLLTYWGARRFGATWQGALGGIAGGIIGAIFFNLPGLILGPLVGVLIVEFSLSGNLRTATRAGIGTIIGGLLAFAAKFAVTILMILGFFLSLIGWF